MKASTTLLLFRRICAPPELSIRIFDPITSYFVIASFILHLNQRYFKRIRRSLYHIPADCKSAGTLALLVFIDRNILKKSTRHLTLTPITTLTTLTTETKDMKANTTFAFDFNSYNYFNYSNSYPHYLFVNFPIIYFILKNIYHDYSKTNIQDGG